MSVYSALVNPNDGRGLICAAFDDTDRLRLRDQAPVYERLDTRLYWSYHCAQCLITWDSRQFSTIKFIKVACLDYGDAAPSLWQTRSNSQSCNAPSDALKSSDI